MDEDNRREYLLGRLKNLFASGYTQAEFWRKSGLTYSTLDGIRKGRVTKQKSLNKIERFFKMYDQLKKVEDEYGL